MIVRQEQQFVRRRRIAGLVAVAFLALTVMGISRLVGFLAGSDAEAAPAPRATQAKAAAAIPSVPVPKPSPAERQGDPGPSAETAMVQILRLTGDLASKSVVASSDGTIFAQNMMYKHTVSVFRADGALLKTIKDSVNLAKHGVSGHAGVSKGSPVEMAFSPDGKHAWVSNYAMYGKGFGPEPHDNCTAGDGSESSFVYQVNTSTYAIEKVVPVGSVPKYVAVTPDGKQVLVSNWCTWDLSVIDTATAKETARIPLGGKHPRGIVVSPDSRTAYVGLMGSDRLVTVDLETRKVSAFAATGARPRHLVISPDAKYLYVSNNNDDTVTKVERASGKVLQTVKTGDEPRSMAISSDGGAIYTVNYSSSTVTKLRTSDLKIVDEVKTDPHPIGIAYEPTKKHVWVACYGGSILVLDDSRRPVA